MLPRINTVSERIRSADLFPRIRDAEMKMEIFEEKWRRTKAKRSKELKIKGNLNNLDQVGISEDSTTSIILINIVHSAIYNYTHITE